VSNNQTKPWLKLASKPIADFRIFKIRQDTCVNPRTSREHDFYIADSVDWVNVVALTTDGRMVLVEQYRHGSQTVELEIPGGMMDPHDNDPVAAGVRELREETGYAGGPAKSLGKLPSNPAIFGNYCHTVLVENCTLQHSVEFDSGEDLATHLVPVADVARLVAEEKIRHPLVVAALYHFELWQRGLKK